MAGGPILGGAKLASTGGGANYQGGGANCLGGGGRYERKERALGSETGRPATVPSGRETDGCTRTWAFIAAGAANATIRGAPRLLVGKNEWEKL